MRKWDWGCIQLSDSQSPESRNFKAVWNPVAFTHIVFSTVQNVHQPFQFTWNMHSGNGRKNSNQNSISTSEGKKKVIMISKKKRFISLPRPKSVEYPRPVMNAVVKRTMIWCFGRKQVSPYSSNHLKNKPNYLFIHGKLLKMKCNFHWVNGRVEY